jgi:hypothetical protein
MFELLLTRGKHKREKYTFIHIYYICCDPVFIIDLFIFVTQSKRRLDCQSEDISQLDERVKTKSNSDDIVFLCMFFLNYVDFLPSDKKIEEWGRIRRRLFLLRRTGGSGGLVLLRRSSCFCSSP